jgi:phosphoglucomutase
MDYKTRYDQWLNDPVVDEATKEELRAISDEREIEDRFYKDLDFGTGGLRGVLAAGANRLNIYTIRKATQGLANYILSQATENTAAADSSTPFSVAIAHDSRRMSPEFSREAALVLNGNGIKTYVFDSLRPTPVLSFAVRHLGCAAGIVITASHNPPEYNGYKCYWSDGGQVPYPRDEEIIGEVNKVTSFSQIKTMAPEEAEAKGLYNIAPPSVDDAYIAAVKACCLHPEIIPESDIKIIYTPLHGTGNVPVRRVLAETGFKHVYTVPEQEAPDSGFPTVSYPNPEDKKAFTLALKLAAEKDGDLIIATDPDADRVGIAVKDQNEYRLLTGNMTGVLMTDYLLSQRKVKNILPANSAVISTIVSTDMTKAIAAEYGAAYIEVLTGFKYIGEKIKEFEASGDFEYIFGFEESYGCLPGTYTRDKDAVAATLLICEMAAFYRKQGLTLLDALDKLYEKYGFFSESVESITLKGLEGIENMKKIMAALRLNPPKVFGESVVTEARDYASSAIYLPDGATQPTGLPVSDVLYYAMADGSWACVRPSGTEPKIKIYFGVVIHGDLTTAVIKARAQLSELWAAMKKIVDGVITA